jgi:hypothetical protein
MFGLLFPFLLFIQNFHRTQATGLYQHRPNRWFRQRICWGTIPLLTIQHLFRPEHSSLLHHPLRTPEHQLLHRRRTTNSNLQRPSSIRHKVQGAILLSKHSNSNQLMDSPPRSSNSSKGTISSRRSSINILSNNQKWDMGTVSNHRSLLRDTLQLHTLNLLTFKNLKVRETKERAEVKLKMYYMHETNLDNKSIS